MNGVAALIDAMLHAVWLVETDSLRIVAANAAAGTLMGVEPAWLVGRDMHELAATPEDICFWDDAVAGASQAIESDSWVRRCHVNHWATASRTRGVWVSLKST